MTRYTYGANDGPIQSLNFLLQLQATRSRGDFRPYLAIAITSNHIRCDSFRTRQIDQPYPLRQLKAFTPTL